MNPKAPSLSDWQVLENIVPYLNFSDLIKTSVLSKEFNYNLKSYFRKHILPKESLKNNSDQLQIAKRIYHRQIKIHKIDSNTEIKFAPNLIITGLEVGLNYTLIETYHGQKIVVKNSQLQNKKNELKIYEKLPRKYNTKHAHLVGQNIYTSNDNKLIKIALNQGQKDFFTQVDTLIFQGEIIYIKISQTHIFIITQNTLNQHNLFAVSLKNFKSNQVNYKTQNSITQINTQNLYVAANTSYYIENFKVYDLDVQNMKQPKLLKSLKDKNIRKIINGAKHFFAIERMGKITEEWTTEDVIAWAKKQGYEDYVKIFKSEKVTGKTLLNMNKRYMEDVLGLINVKLQQRLFVLLEENNVEKQQNCTIWGWGRNDKSQLGVHPSNPISNPFKVQLPEGYTLLLCSNNITLIHNKKLGKIAMNSVKQGKADWHTILENVYNVWEISCYKDLLMLLCPVQKKHISQQMSQTPVHVKKQKLRTAKNIIDKISWDQNVNKKDFRVGYLDKFTGILEVSFEQLLQSTEIKDYRIQYFKRNGELIWSKKDRIDIF